MKAISRISLSLNRNVINFIRLESTASQPQPPLKTVEQMPGLNKLPIIGTLHHFLPVIGSIGPKGNFFDMLSVMNDRYGPIVKFDVIARSTLVILYDPDDYDQVYRAEEENPLRPGFETILYYRNTFRKSTFEGLNSLLVAQGSDWREFRTKVNPALLKIKLVKLYSPGLEEISSEFVEKIKKLKNAEYLQENFDGEISKFALECLGFIGLGTRLGCLKEDLSADHPAKMLMQSAKDILDLSFKLEFLPNPWKYISTPSFKKIMRAYDIQWQISTMYIEEARNNILRRNEELQEEEKSVIEKLLAIDDRVAIMMANEMLMAGVDTVSFVTTGLLYHLSTNLDKQEKLRQEIRSPTNNRRYLKACIKEALRIWPVIPANLRRTSKEHAVKGYLIPKGIEVIAPNEYLCRQEKYFAKPAEYLPERWLVDKSDPLYYGKAHPMVYLPFGFGVRSCIGRRIAELEIETLVSKLVDEFQITWNGPPIKVVTKLLNGFEKPYRFQFTPIKE